MTLFLTMSVGSLKFDQESIFVCFRFVELESLHTYEKGKHVREEAGLGWINQDLRGIYGHRGRVYAGLGRAVATQGVQRPARKFSKTSWIVSTVCLKLSEIALN